MRKLGVALLLLPLILLPAAQVSAQERGQAGLVMGIPTNFGFIWHASDKLAVRPELGLTFTANESESNVFGSTSSESDGHAVTVGASVLWYLAKYDNVRTYVAPRFTYGHASTENSQGTSTPSDAVSVSGNFGAQFTPARKFAVFGEIGYGFNRTTSEFSSPIVTAETKSTAWSTRGAVGVIFYFGS